ncbi:hypothetical protein RM531_08170 [Salinisphaera sp. P385]|uniref:Uncharacterized protein n=1 Tax=Spectribacter acetivorans TaxID=3075603 RepID=A0ABU3B8Q1_9GAMM|nr:hypothetical protein [Salinisphaera sp. P385]MDT0618450.1 hypothetical protein [Salinisphaera sp. P385]
MDKRDKNTVELDHIRDAQSEHEQQMLKRALMEMAGSGRPVIVQECGDIVHVCRNAGEVESLLRGYWKRSAAVR